MTKASVCTAAVWALMGGFVANMTPLLLPTPLVSAQWGSTSVTQKGGSGAGAGANEEVSKPEPEPEPEPQPQPAPSPPPVAAKSTVVASADSALSPHKGGSGGSVTSPPAVAPKSTKVASAVSSQKGGAVGSVKETSQTSPGPAPPPASQGGAGKVPPEVSASGSQRSEKYTPIFLMLLIICTY